MVGYHSQQNQLFVFLSLCEAFFRIEKKTPSVYSSQCLIAMQSLQETNVWLCWLNSLKGFIGLRSIRAEDRRRVKHACDLRHFLAWH